MVSKVQVFKTSNGEIFEKEEDAIFREKEIQLRNSISKLLNDADIVHDYDTIMEFIVDHDKEVYEILKTKFEN